MFVVVDKQLILFCFDRLVGVGECSEEEVEEYEEGGDEEEQGHLEYVDVVIPSHDVTHSI